MDHFNSAMQLSETTSTKEIYTTIHSHTKHVYEGNANGKFLWQWNLYYYLAHLGNRDFNRKFPVEVVLL